MLLLLRLVLVRGCAKLMREFRKHTKGGSPGTLSRSVEKQQPTKGVEGHKNDHILLTPFPTPCL